MTINISKINNLEFTKFVKNTFNKSPKNLRPWEYREVLSLYQFNEVIIPKTLSNTQINEICESIIKNTDFSWADLNLNISDEAKIQKQLRKYGYELKCFELDIFPTDSQSMNKLLIKSEIMNNLRGKFYNIFRWSPFWVTLILIGSLFFADINIWLTFLVTYILAPTLTSVLHNYILHDTNLRFKNKLLEFMGLFLVYFYVFDVRPGSKESHALHHKLWRSQDDPLVNEMRTGNLLSYIFCYTSISNMQDQQNLLLFNHCISESSTQPTFPTQLLKYRWWIVSLFVALWIGIFGFSSWVSFHLIPIWFSIVIMSRINDVIFHGPQTWSDYKKERDVPWLMPIMFGSAYHITHHIYSDDLYFGPGKVRYFNLEYWCTLFFFDVSKTKIKY
jgi:fatty-acid desaturase